MAFTINKLDTAGEWMVDSNHLYIPKAGIKVEHQNVAGSGSGRTEDGKIHIDWIRRDVRKFYLGWSVMTESELNYVISLMQGREFQFKGKDRGSVVSLKAYCGECSYTLYTTDYRGMGISLYKDVSINVIEI